MGLVMIAGMMMILVSVIALFYHTEKCFTVLRQEMDDLWIRQKESIEERHSPAPVNLNDILESSANRHIARRNAKLRRKSANKECPSLPMGYASFKLDKGYFSRCLKTKSISECQAFGYHELRDSLNITAIGKSIPWTFQQFCAERQEYELRDPFRICIQNEGTYLILSQLTVVRSTMISLQLKVDNVPVRQCKSYGTNLLPRTVCAMSHIVKATSRSCLSLHTLEIPLAVQYNPNDSLMQIIRLE